VLAAKLRLASAQGGFLLNVKGYEKKMLPTRFQCQQSQMFKREEGKCQQKKTEMTCKTTWKHPLTKEEKCPSKFQLHWADDKWVIGGGFSMLEHKHHFALHPSETDGATLAWLTRLS
jgi:hypothetical protein